MMRLPEHYAALAPVRTSSPDEGRMGPPVASGRGDSLNEITLEEATKAYVAMNRWIVRRDKVLGSTRAYPGDSADDILADHGIRVGKTPESWRLWMRYADEIIRRAKLVLRPSAA